MLSDSLRACRFVKTKINYSEENDVAFFLLRLFRLILARELARHGPAKTTTRLTRVSAMCPIGARALRQLHTYVGGRPGGAAPTAAAGDCR